MTEQFEKWMARMDGKIDKLGEDMAELKAMRGQLKDHQERIFGNGQPGLLKDVDRLKQWKKAIFWWVGVAVASPALAEVVKVVLAK